MYVRTGDFEDAQVRALLGLHLAGMRAHSPACSVHALDLSGLQHPAVSFFTVHEGQALLAMGALIELDPYTGELKSMRTADAHLRKGAGAFLLTHLIETARARGYPRLSLETGSGPAFEPALALYRRFGFAQGAAYGEYAASDFNQFFHLDL